MRAPATRSFPRRIQLDGYSCAAVCTQMVVEYFTGRVPSLERIREAIGTTEDGTEVGRLARYFRERGYKVRRLNRRTFEALTRAVIRGVVIAEVGRNHICVVHDLDEKNVHVAEPGLSPIFGRESRKHFRSRWGGNGWVIEHPKGRPGAAILDYNQVTCPQTGASIDVQVLEDYVFDCPDCDGDICSRSRGTPRNVRAGLN